MPQYKELDVFIKRDQETGFGFRVLGGEGTELPVNSIFCHLLLSVMTQPPFANRCVQGTLTCDVNLMSTAVNASFFHKVYIGAVIPQGAAEKDGCLRAGDELMAIDGITVRGKSHKQVLDLMTNAARNGQVLLTVRRKVIYRGEL